MITKLKSLSLSLYISHRWSLFIEFLYLIVILKVLFNCNLKVD